MTPKDIRFNVAVPEFEKYLQGQRHSRFRRTRQQRPQSTVSCLHPEFETCVRHDLVVPIWKTAKVYSARRGACIAIGPFVILAEFRTPMSHKIVLSIATSSWLHNVPELSPFCFIVCYIQPKPGSFHGATGETFDGSLSTRYEQIYGIVCIRVPKTRGMAGHAAQ